MKYTKAGLCMNTSTKLNLKFFWRKNTFTAIWQLYDAQVNKRKQKPKVSGIWFLLRVWRIWKEHLLKFLATGFFLKGVVYNSFWRHKENKEKAFRLHYRPLYQTRNTVSNFWNTRYYFQIGEWNLSMSLRQFIEISEKKVCDFALVRALRALYLSRLSALWDHSRKSLSSYMYLIICWSIICCAVLYSLCPKMIATN